MRFRSGAALLVATQLLACRGRDVPDITVIADANARVKVGFSPRSAFAEYVEVPEQRHELRLTLASYETSCEEYRPPPEGESVVTVLVLTPPAEPPAAGEYGFGLVPRLDAPVTQAVAIPKAQLAGRSWLFQPGGGLRLTEVQLEPHGTVSGMLDFSYPGDADHAASRIQGRFSAWMCRSAPAPKR
jgi:hypothetical protein